MHTENSYILILYMYKIVFFFFFEGGVGSKQRQQRLCAPKRLPLGVVKQEVAVLVVLVRPLVFLRRWRRGAPGRG